MNWDFEGRNRLQNEESLLVNGVNVMRCVIRCVYWLMTSGVNFRCEAVTEITTVFNLYSFIPTVLKKTQQQQKKHSPTIHFELTRLFVSNFATATFSFLRKVLELMNVPFDCFLQRGLK